MRTTTIAAMMLFAGLIGARSAGAQELRGFATAGVASDLNSRYPAAGGGALVSLGQPWVSAGAQGEAFVSWPYFSGRGATFGQVNLIPRRPVRPFLLVGYGFGASAGPMIGAGLDFLPPNHRAGLRISVEDYLVDVQGFDCASVGYSQSYCGASQHGGRAYTGHQISVRVGILFH